MAIKNGTIDGQSSGQTAILSRKIYEVCKYFTTTNHSYVGYLLAINDNSWKKLSPDQQKLVNEVAKEIRDEIRKETKSEDERCLKELAAKGMDVYTVPADEVKLWQDATAGFRLRHALHAVHARLKFQPRVRARAADLKIGLLYAAKLRLAVVEQLDRPALRRGVEVVHPEQAVGKQGAFLAADAAADLQRLITNL